MHENEIAAIILQTSLDIHRELGPGLLERAYEIVLLHELRDRGLVVYQQHPVPLHYHDLRIPGAFRADLLVEDKVLVEIKSVERLAPVHYAQTLTYLRLTELKLGLLINFHEKWLKDGFHRLVNGL
jgi:GxxExxY protein